MPTQKYCLPNLACDDFGIGPHIAAETRIAVVAVVVPLSASPSVRLRSPKGGRTQRARDIACPLKRAAPAAERKRPRGVRGRTEAAFWCGLLARCRPSAAPLGAQYITQQNNPPFPTISHNHFNLEANISFQAFRLSLWNQWVRTKKSTPMILPQ